MTTPTHSHKDWTDKGGHINLVRNTPSERLGDVGTDVIAHRSPALDPFLVVEPSNGTADKADHRWRLLDCQHLDVDQPRGVINPCMDLVVDLR